MSIKNLNLRSNVFIIVLFFLTILVQQVSAVEQDDYTKVITKRAQKIVDKLQLDQEKAAIVREMIVQQYRGLNDLESDLEQQKITSKAIVDKEEAAKQLEKAVRSAEKKTAKLHIKYLKNLRKELSDAQLEQVKNEMTYNVLPITYKGYLEMLPSLSPVQKEQILSYLTEAREKAMDAGSSEEKHAWFGKYKGKINNYLSKEGVETKIARQVWEKKIKEEQTRK